MKTTSRWKSGIAALVAVGSVFGVSAVSDVANALPAGTPPENGGGVTLTPGSGSFATPFNFTYNPTNQVCPGDNTQGWFFSPYLTADDPATLTFSAAGSPISAAGGRTTALRDIGGNLVRNIFPNLVDGALIGIPDISFQETFALTPLVPGVYNVGVACFNANAVTVGGVSLGVRENAKYWNTQVTFTGAGAVAGAFAEGAAPAAPALTTVTYNPVAVRPTTATVNFTHAVSNPATAGYTATVTQTAGPAAPIADIPVPAGATSFDIPGLDAGESYSVTLIATNSAGSSVASNAILVTGDVVTPPPVVDPIVVFEGLEATISWTAPASGPAPVSYDVTVDGPTAVGPFIGETGTSVTIPPSANLALGNYTVTVTPNYAAGSGVTGTPGTATLSVSPNALIYQDITVERPAGALVLTQRCGVFGGFPAFDTTGWPGAELTLDPVDAVGGAGTAPTLVDALGNDTGTPDPLFTSYPQRGTYPTLCGVNLGAGELATAGPFAGRYYVADGSINQVTVLDTRDGDLGWNAKGDIADLFTSGPAPFDENNSFTGDFLGWFPQVSSTSTGQTVTPGSPVGPGTLNTPANVGMTGNPTLASAPAGAGLGIATLDARLALLIPVAADADTYTARLSLTVA